ncbi:hypothetical protein LTR08_008203 [Meristemomyces frigidus]|nr:hypothetical protein LTR08_008203 [Meristemomyces frigidus]
MSAENPLVITDGTPALRSKRTPLVPPKPSANAVMEAVWTVPNLELRNLLVKLYNETSDNR